MDTVVLWGTIKYSRKIKVLIFLKYCCKVDPLMEDEFYNVLLDWNAQKLEELLELCARYILRRKTFEKRKMGH